MARPLRIQFPGAFYHVISRGQERGDIFRGTADYDRLLEDLCAVREKHALRVHAYCLMKNHYHLMVETPLPNLSRALQNLQTRYSVYFNRKHRRVGHLFSGRYKAILVEKEAYGLELSRYIHLNPVRAGLCERPEDYEPSSFRFYLRERLPDGIPLDLSWTLAQFHRRPDHARHAYREFVSEGLAKAHPDLARAVRSQAILGGDAFIDRVKAWAREAHPEGGRDPLDVPAARHLRACPVALDAVVRAVSAACRMSPEALRAGPRAGSPRMIAMFLAVRRGDRTLAQIGEYFGGIQYSAVAKAVGRLEQRLERDATLRHEVEDCERRLR